MHSDIDPGTIAAYRETEYRVFAPPLVLHIGVPCADLAILQENAQVTCSAFITACNPLGDVLEEALNIERQEHLARQLAHLGLKALKGEGRHPSGRWAEPSFLILGLERGAAEELGQQFQQNAIVWAGTAATPELILLR